MNEPLQKTASVSLPEDLSERQRQLDELDYANRCFTQALNSPQHVLYRLNVQKGCYDYLSPALEQFTGYPVSEFKNTSLEKLWDYFHPDDRVRVSALIDAAFRTRTGTTVTFDLEYRLRKADGGYCWLHDSTTACFNEQGELECFFGSAHDVTERKQAEQELNHSHQLLRYIIEHSRSAIAVHDKDLNYIYVSQRYLQEYGVKEKDIIGKHHYDVFPDLPQKWRDVHQKALSGEVSSAEDDPYIREDGSVDWTCWECRPWYGADGAIGGIIIYTEVVTERKRAEEERLKLEQQLLHTQKLESLGVLAGGIAHDFNNILTAIIGNADLALKCLDPESPVQENLKRIKNAAGRASDLAQQMLAYSGKGKFRVETIDLNRLIEEMGHMLEVSISKKAALRFNPTRPLPLVDADATQIRQILMNLVINSSEAIEERSGVITINTGYMQCDEEYLQETWLTEQLPGGLYVSMEVADSGCGMDQETLDRIFDPFFTTKFTGRGLGMAAVQGIIRGHKGSIKICSEPGKGTTFKVLLPASARQAEEFTDATHEQEWKGEGKVLLVDDEAPVRQVVTEMLKFLGFTAIPAADGREAVELFKNTPDIAFVLLDLTMPNMDGEQCFRELRQLDPQVKVVMSSGFSEHEVTKKFAGKGLAGFIQKPYKLSSLQETLRCLAVPD
jgi:PAS domain S-box-containing protein